MSLKGKQKTCVRYKAVTVFVFILKAMRRVLMVIPILCSGKKVKS